MEELNVVHAKAEHAKILAELLTAAIKTKQNYDDNSWGDSPFTVDETTDLIENSDVYLFFKESELLGTVSLTWTDEKTWGKQKVKAGYIHRLATKAGNKGLGARIILYAEDIMLQRNVFRSRLDCHESNASLCYYYETKGYKKVSVIGDETEIALFEKVLA